MLQLLRNSVASIFVKVFVGLIVLSFAIWGIDSSIFSGFLSDTVAKVGKLKISTQEVGQQYQRELNNMRSRNLDPANARQMGVLEQVVQSMVSRAVFSVQARELGFTASDEDIARFIRRNPNFRNNLGKFDRLQFDQLLRSNGLTEEGYVAELRQDLAVGQLLDSVTRGTRSAKALTGTIFTWRNEQRIADALYVAVDPKAKVGSASEADLAAYHKSNPGKFSAPEYRTVRFIALSSSTFAPKIEVSEEDLRRLFEERRQEFATPETRDVLQIVLTEKADADKAVARIRKGETFETVGKEIAGQSGDDLKLGFIKRNDLPTELAAPVFSLADQSISDPMKGPFGWHIIKILKVLPAKKADFATAKDALRKGVVNERAEDEVYRIASKLEDSIGGGATLKEAANKFGLSLKLLAAIDASGKNKAGTVVKDLPGTPFIETVFQAQQGVEGRLTETQDGGFFIAVVESIEKARLRPLSEVRKSVTTAWRAAKRIELARKRAESIKRDLESGKSLGEIKSAAGIGFTTLKPIGRNGTGAPAELPFSVLAELFDLKRTGDIALGAAGDKFVLLKLREIKRLALSADKKGRDQLVNRVRSGLSSDLLFQLNRALRESLGVTINRDNLSRLHSMGQS